MQIQLIGTDIYLTHAILCCDMIIYLEADLKHQQPWFGTTDVSTTLSLVFTDRSSIVAHTLMENRLTQVHVNTLWKQATNSHLKVPIKVINHMPRGELLHKQNSRGDTNHLWTTNEPIRPPHPPPSCVSCHLTGPVMWQPWPQRNICCFKPWLWEVKCSSSIRIQSPVTTYVPIIYL